MLYICFTYAFQPVYARISYVRRLRRLYRVLHPPLQYKRDAWKCVTYVRDRCHETVRWNSKPSVPVIIAICLHTQWSERESFHETSACPSLDCAAREEHTR